MSSPQDPSVVRLPSVNISRFQDRHRIEEFSRSSERYARACALLERYLDPQQLEQFRRQGNFFVSLPDFHLLALIRPGYTRVIFFHEDGKEIAFGCVVWPNGALQWDPIRTVWDYPPEPDMMLALKLEADIHPRLFMSSVNVLYRDTSA